jgi:UDP-N-acetylmuramoyl-tripeptide--D-alanyl-D-alanine ligase
VSARGGSWVAEATGAEVLAEGAPGGFERPLIDSREARAGDLFFGLPGERADGGEFALAALRAGAWGVLAGPQWAREMAQMRERGAHEFEGWVFAADEPLAALQALSTAWRRELAAKVVGITGSTGKTSVKDVCAAILPLSIHASPENYNTEIGLPLAILGAPEGTEALVLEMGMRGPGQIAELARIAEPDVGVITNVGPVHVELLGSIEAIAAAKAELLSELHPDAAAVVPADPGPLDRHLGDGAPVRIIRFGERGDVRADSVEVSGGRTRAVIATPEGEADFELPFDEAHNLTNVLAAVAAGTALGLPLGEMAQRAPGIVFSRLRGEHVRLPGDSILINDCYNANPISMHAALDHLGSLEVLGRRIAVLGEMRELGPDAAEYHREVGEHAREHDVEHVIGVGELAAHYGPDVSAEDAEAAAEALREALGEGDAVLVKGSRAVGLELVAERLGEGGEG